MNVTRMNDRMDELGMSRSQLIRKSGVSESTMRRIWHGCTDVRTSTVRMIADALSIDVHELIDAEKPVPTAFDPEQAAEVPETALEIISVVAEGQTIVIKPDTAAASDGRSPDPGGSGETVPTEIVTKTYADMLDTMSQLVESYKERLIEMRDNSDATLLKLEQAYRAHTVMLKRMSILFGIVTGVLMLFVIALFSYDFLDPSIGWFRH